MNTTLIAAFWLERFTSPIRLLLLVTTWLFLVLIAIVVKPALPPDGGDMFIPMLVLGAGVIGRDLSTGVLQLILARPVTRREYVVSRWLGLGTAGFAVGLAWWVAVFPFAVESWMATRDTSFGWFLIHGIRSIGEIGLACFGMAAVITGLSSLLPGFGDLALLVVVNIMGGFVMMLGDGARSPGLRRVGRELMNTLVPTIDLGRLWDSAGFHWYPFVAWASSTVLGLLLAIFAMNRREFSYGSAG